MEPMTIGLPLLVAIIVIALAFDLSNGMHVLGRP